MKLSSKTRYGLRICHALAVNTDNSPQSASELEKELGVSAKYIEKIMRILAKRGIVSAVRGAAGGYYLSRKPKDITVGEIVRALEDDFETVQCITAPCVSCASSSVWKKMYDGINEVLNNITLENMASEHEQSCGKCNEENR